MTRARPSHGAMLEKLGGRSDRRGLVRLIIQRRRPEVVVLRAQLRDAAEKPAELVRAHLRIEWPAIVGEQVRVRLPDAVVGALSLREPPAVLAVNHARIDLRGYVRLLLDASAARLDEHPVVVLDAELRGRVRMDVAQRLRMALAAQRKLAMLRVEEGRYP